MCLSKPKMPKAPDPVQEVKQPDLANLRRAKKVSAAMGGGGTLLTGPSGLTGAVANATQNTLLGS